MLTVYVRVNRANLSSFTRPMLLMIRMVLSPVDVLLSAKTSKHPEGLTNQFAGSDRGHDRSIVGIRLHPLSLIKVILFTSLIAYLTRITISHKLSQKYIII